MHTSKSLISLDTLPAEEELQIGKALAQVTVAVAVTALFGAAVSTLFSGMSPATGAWSMLLVCGTGWLAQLGWVAISHPPRASWYVAQLFSLMARGVLPLIPVSLFMLLGGTAWPVLPALAVGISASSMFLRHHAAVQVARLSHRYTLLWLLNLGITAAVWWMLLFHYA